MERRVSGGVEPLRWNVKPELERVAQDQADSHRDEEPELIADSVPTSVAATPPRAPPPAQNAEDADWPRMAATMKQERNEFTVILIHGLSSAETTLRQDIHEEAKTREEVRAWT